MNCRQLKYVLSLVTLLAWLALSNLAIAQAQNHTRSLNDSAVLQPPSNGDWIIDNQEFIVENEVITLNGSLLLQNGANVTFRTVSIKMNSPSGQHYRIEVGQGCSLTIERQSTITAANPTNPWYFLAIAGSTVLLQDSTLSYAGYEESSEGKYSGIWINTPNAQVVNCTLHHNYQGLVFHDTINAVIRGNTVLNSTSAGIRLSWVHHSLVSGNTITDSLHGISIYDSRNLTIQANHISDLENFGIAALFLNDSLISTNTITTSYYGIHLLAGTNVSVKQNALVDNRDWGIHLDHTFNSTMTRNSLTRNGVGLLATTASTISYNEIQEGPTGIWLSQTNTTTILGNTITNCSQNGLAFQQGSCQNNVSSNVILANSRYGISLEASTGNCVLWVNTLASNKQGNAFDASSMNHWDNGSLGNWWADYRGPDWNQDSRGDSPYKIPGGPAQDRFPLMNLTDVTSPDISDLPSVILEEGSPENNLTWQVAETNPYWYNITRNGSLVAQGFWNSTVITIDLVHLSPGIYSFTLSVFDRLGNGAQSNVLVTVAAKASLSKQQRGDSSTINGFQYFSLLLGLLIAFRMKSYSKKEKNC